MYIFISGEKLETVNDDLEQPESIRERRGSNIQPKTALHEGKLGKNWKQLINLDRDVDSYSAFLLAKQNLISKGNTCILRFMGENTNIVFSCENDTFGCYLFLQCSGTTCMYLLRNETSA